MEETARLRRIHDRIDGDFPAHLERCRAFLRQKSISASGEGIRETAAVVKGFIEELGGAVRYGGTEDFPIVYGRVDAGRPRTLIVYGMYDVQPVEEAKWTSPPFGAEIRELPRLGPCVIARGAVNSKGALAGVFNALRSVKDEGGLPVNLIFVVEGEEEIGSPHLEPFIRERRDELTGLGVVDFDFSQDSTRKVSLHLGLKGIVYLDLKCRGQKTFGPSESVHSSVSAWIASPVWRLVHALSSIVDEDENILIEGFAENVAPVAATDLRILEDLARTFNEREFLREMKGLGFKHKATGVELLKKGLYSPIINIDGLTAGYSGAGTKTVLPRVATAKVDIRFGPDMEPAEVIDKFKRHLARRGFEDIEVTVRDNYTWSKTDAGEDIVDRLVGAYRRHGVEPEIWPMATWAAPYFVFSRILRLPLVSGGLGHGGRQHSPDEYMTVEGLRDFEKFVATFLDLLGR
jgi:acetylornithine deacetylase/succinyl-diaminopimelate desuccinylase-like protein